jgi:anti-anti-sigma regulatory factor
MSDQQEQPRVEVVFTRTQRSRDEVVLSVDGPLTDDVADELHLQFEGLIAGSWRVVTLDLAKVKGISSRCLGKIMFLRMRLIEKKEQGRSIRIQGCDPALYLDLKAARFDFFMDIQQ